MKLKERITSEISLAKFQRKPLTARSALLHKGTNECAPRILKWSALFLKSINDSVPRTPKRKERALSRWRGSGAHGGQDSTGCDIGSRTSKSLFPPEEPDSRIFRGYCGAKEFGNPGSFHIKPNAYAEDEQRRSKLPGDVAEDNPVLGKSKSWKEKVARHQGQSPRASQGKTQVQRDGHGNTVEGQF